jgi:hypothetical protein
MADAIEAASSALSHLASSSTSADATNVVNRHTTQFAQALEVRAPKQ